MNLQPGVCGIVVEGPDDSQILNNKITGSGNLAIRAGLFGPTRRGLIKGNNLAKFTPFASSLVYPFKILLGEGTLNYTVVGESNEQILDLGTNNLITGWSTHSHNKPGEAMRKAMQQEMGIFKNLGRGVTPLVP